MCFIVSFCSCRDAILVSVANCATSFFAGFVVFGILGFMASEMGLKVAEVAKQGRNLILKTDAAVILRMKSKGN